MKKETIYIFADDVRNAKNIKEKLAKDFSNPMIIFSSANKFNFAISDRIYLFLPKVTTKDEFTFSYDLEISPEMEKIIKKVRDVGTVLFIHPDWRKQDKIEIFENVDVSTDRSNFEESKRYVAFGDNLLTFKDYMDWKTMFNEEKEDASKKIYVIGGDLETYQNYHEVKDILQKMYFDYLILDGNDVDFSKLKNANIIIIPENVSELKGSTYNIDLPYYVKNKLSNFDLFYNNHKVVILGTIDPERYDDVRVHGNIKEETFGYREFETEISVTAKNYDIIEKFIPRDIGNYIIRDIDASNKDSKDPTIYFSKAKVSDKDTAEAIRLMIRSKMPNVIIREFKGGKYNTDELLKSDYLLTLPAKIENGNIMLGKGTYNEIITALDNQIPVHVICEKIDLNEKDFITFSPSNKNCIKVIDRNWTDSYATIESFNFKGQKFIKFFDTIRNAYNPYRIKDNFTDDNFKDTKKLNLSKTFKDIFQDIEVVNKGVKIVAVYDEKLKEGQEFQAQYESYKKMCDQYLQNVVKSSYSVSSDGILNPRIGVPFGAPWTSTKPFSLDAPPLQGPWNTSGIILNNDPSFKLYLEDEKIAEFKKIINENEMEYDEEACEVIIKKTNQNLKGIIPLGVLKDFPDIYIIKTRRPFIEENLSLKKLYKFNYEWNCYRR